MKTISEDVKKAALVTGGAQGIGKAVALELLRRGYAVLVCDHDAEAGEDLVQAWAAAGELHFQRCDVGKEKDVRAAVAAAVKAFGRLDALVNNAALSDPESGPPERLTLAAWNRVLGVNLTGGFLMAKHAAPALRRAGGAVVNIASTRALMSEPHTEAYAASKGGLVALTHALAMSLAPEVRVNCISPGWIAVEDWRKPSARREPDLRPLDHAQHPAGRVGRPPDVAALAGFLLSDEAAFITGQNYVIDGGMTRKMIYAP